jgi:hypothetical protein
MTRSSPAVLRLALLSAFALSSGGCGGGGSDSTFDGNYAGDWDVRYNLSQDDCGIVESGVIGFVDRHSIIQNGKAITLDIASGFGPPLTGEVQSDNTFTAEQLLKGTDFFAGGVFCTIHQAISYQPEDLNKASTLFLREVSCADGFTCVSKGVGESVRRTD